MVLGIQVRNLPTEIRARLKLILSLIRLTALLPAHFDLVNTYY
jgi:hypothetical protein